jgi:hypothetical protein
MIFTQLPAGSCCFSGNIFQVIYDEQARMNEDFFGVYHIQATMNAVS